MRALTIPALVVGLWACNGDGGTVPDFPRGCDESTIDGDCIVYTGAGWTEGEVVAECENGTIVESCPAGEIGRCTLDSDTDNQTVSYFYPQFWNGGQAAQQCATRGGTWTDA